MGETFRSLWNIIMMNIYLLDRNHLAPRYEEQISMVVYARWPQQARKIAEQSRWDEPAWDRINKATVKKIGESKTQHFEEVILIADQA
jgi:hypothetical protein